MTSVFVDLCLGAPSLPRSGPTSDGALPEILERFRGLIAEAGPLQAAAALEGDFAVATAVAPGHAVLAVDRFAMRSLCYRVIDGQLHCAERADELANIEPVARIDLQALYDYLYFHVIPSPRTVFEGVARLPPAHCAVFRDNVLTVQPYWAPRFEEDHDTGFDVLAARFRQRLQSAVASQLDGGKPACFLSGGTDSSSVAGMIGLAAGRPAATYSIGFDAEGYDEMQFARIAARHFGTEHHEYYVTPADVARGIPEVAGHYDQPFGNSSAVPAYYCAKLAREDGVTRLLAGDGGDELFGGNSRYAKQRIFGWWGAVPGPLRTRVFEPLLGRQVDSGSALVRKAASYVEQARVPMPQRLEMYNLLHRVGAERMLEPAFLARIDRASPAAQQLETWGGPQGASPINRTLAFDWRYTLAEADLPKVRGSAQLAGVGVGFPFLEDRLLDFSMRLPSHYKLKGLKLRWFFKEALRGFLPDEIIAKRKQGFGLPFGVWAVRDPILDRLAADSLASLAGRGIVRPAFIRELRTELLPAHPGYYGELVWILTMLEQWLQRHRPGFAIAD